MDYPGALFFGIFVILGGVVVFALRGAQGRFAHQYWKSIGFDRIALTPEKWAAITVPFCVMMWLVGSIFVVAGATS